MWDEYIDMYKTWWTPLVYLWVLDKEWYSPKTNYTKLWNLETEIIDLSENVSDESDGEIYLAIFDTWNNNRISGGLGIARTIFVCLILAIGAMIFIKISNDLVIGPIEDMIQKIKLIAKNPLEAAHEEENLELVLE